MPERLENLFFSSPQENLFDCRVFRVHSAACCHSKQFEWNGKKREKKIHAPILGFYFERLCYLSTCICICLSVCLSALVFVTAGIQTCAAPASPSVARCQATRRSRWASDMFAGRQRRRRLGAGRSPTRERGGEVERWGGGNGRERERARGN